MSVLRLGNKKELRNALVNMYKDNKSEGFIIVDVRDGIWSITTSGVNKTNPAKKYIPFNLNKDIHYHKQNRYGKWYLGKTESLDTRISAIMQNIDRDVFSITRYMPDLNIKPNTGKVTRLRDKTDLREALRSGLTQIYIDIKTGKWGTRDNDIKTMIKISNIDIDTNREYWCSVNRVKDFELRMTYNINSRITAAIQEIEIEYFDLTFKNNRRVSRKITERKVKEWKLV